jgi:hypothetical protein
MLNEIHSADWYNRIYNDVVKDPESTIIIPLKMYCDKLDLIP